MGKNYRGGRDQTYSHFAVLKFAKITKFCLDIIRSGLFSSSRKKCGKPATIDDMAKQEISTIVVSDLRNGEFRCLAKDTIATDPDTLKRFISQVDNWPDNRPGKGEMLRKLRAVLNLRPHVPDYHWSKFVHRALGRKSNFSPFAGYSWPVPRF